MSAASWPHNDAFMMSVHKKQSISCDIPDNVVAGQKKKDDFY